MALKLEFCNVIVPIAKIREKLGDKAFEEHYSLLTGTYWHDGHLFREGCMDDYVLEEILNEWENKGFELLTIKDGVKHWQDLCVVNSGYGPSYPCAWIEYDPRQNIVWLKGQEAGPTIGPNLGDD